METCETYLEAALKLANALGFAGCEDARADSHKCSPAAKDKDARAVADAHKYSPAPKDKDTRVVVAGDCLVFEAGNHPEVDSGLVLAAEEGNTGAPAKYPTAAETAARVAGCYTARRRFAVADADQSTLHKYWAGEGGWRGPRAP